MNLNLFFVCIEEKNQCKIDIMSVWMKEIENKAIEWFCKNTASVWRMSFARILQPHKHMFITIVLYSS